MSSCPNCGRVNESGSAVCECGALLRADVTNVSSGWETETMFRPPAAIRPAVKSYRIAAIATVLVVVSTVLALTWPQIESRLLGTSDESLNSPTRVSRNPQSDIEPTGDVVETDSLLNAESQQGAFDFSPGEHRSGVSTRAGLTLAAQPGAARPEETVMNSNPLDAQLLSDEAKKDANAAPDCKPEITVELKRPEPPAAVAETRSTTKSPDAKTYTLGPRGGCFYVTPTGSKKYVDRSMCGTTAVAAARQ